MLANALEMNTAINGFFQQKLTFLWIFSENCAFVLQLLKSASFQQLELFACKQQDTFFNQWYAICWVVAHLWSVLQSFAFQAILHWKRAQNLLAITSETWEFNFLQRYWPWLKLCFSEVKSIKLAFSKYHIKHLL